MHSRKIRNAFITLSIKKREDELKKAIKQYIIHLLEADPNAISSLRRVVKRLYPEYGEMLEKILVLR